MQAEKKTHIWTYTKTDTKTDTKTQDTGTQRHSGDTKTQEGHKDTLRDTKTQEGRITHS